MRFFQEVASNHVATLGAGYDVLMERGLFWALSRLKVEITRMPHWGETILFETWLCGAEGLFFRRDFIIYDVDGEAIVRGISGWLLVGVSNMRPQRPSTIGIVLPTNTGKSVLLNFPERIATSTLQVAFRKTVAYNEIDQNLHVNNTRYLDWATDCFPMNHYQNYSLSEFALEFLTETHWGDDIELRIGSLGEKTDLEAFETSSGALLFKAILNWKMINH